MINLKAVCDVWWNYSEKGNSMYTCSGASIVQLHTPPLPHEDMFHVNRDSRLSLLKTNSKLNFADDSRSGITINVTENFTSQGITSMALSPTFVPFNLQKLQTHSCNSVSTAGKVIDRLTSPLLLSLHHCHWTNKEGKRKRKEIEPPISLIVAEPDLNKVWGIHPSLCITQIHNNSLYMYKVKNTRDCSCVCLCAFVYPQAIFG